MSKKEEIGARLKEFAENNFKSLADFSRKLGKERNYFTSYFTGKSILGGEMLARLFELGCDINWLLTGTKTEKQHQTIYQQDAINPAAGKFKVNEMNISYSPKDDNLWNLIDELRLLLRKCNDENYQLKKQVEELTKKK